MGELGDADWHLLRAEIPSGLEHPLYLSSIQFYEPGKGVAKAVGTVLIDEIYAKIEATGRLVSLEDFEDVIEWVPIPQFLRTTDFISKTGCTDCPAPRRPRRLAYHSWSIAPPSSAPSIRPSD